MGLKLQCLEGYGRIPMYGRIRARNPKFIRKKKNTILMFEKGNKNYNVLKDKVRIPVSKDKARIPMFGSIRWEF